MLHRIMTRAGIDFKIGEQTEMEAANKNWLEEYFENHDTTYGESGFRYGVVRAYKEYFAVDYPEWDDDYYHAGLIEALAGVRGPVDDPSASYCNQYSQYVRWTCLILVQKSGIAAFIEEFTRVSKTQYVEGELKKIEINWRENLVTRERARLQESPSITAERRRINRVKWEIVQAENAVGRKKMGWDYHDYEPLWGPGITVSNFIARLKSENKKLAWQAFVEGLIPKTSGQSSELKDSLRRLKKKPSIYWYPGSGTDFKPLILDAPNNPTGRRLFRLNEPDFTEDPILFWMNDHSSYLSAEPTKRAFKVRDNWPWYIDKPDVDDGHYDGWGMYGSELSIAEQREDYLFNESVPVVLFTVNIKNKNQASRNRPPDGDKYLVIFSNTPSHVLFEEVIFPCRINVVCTLLAKQGGFSSQIKPFEQYRDIPKILRKCESELGPVDLYLLDDQAHDDETRRPNSPYIRDYDCLGARMRIGWEPCRAFGRPGLLYYRNLGSAGRQLSG